MATASANWWDQPGQQQPAQQQAPPAPPPPQPLTRDDVRQEYDQRTREWAQYASNRRSEYDTCLVKFQSEYKHLAPYQSAAVTFFQSRDDGKTPVGQIFDETVRYVSNLERQGFRPPEAPKQPRGGFPGAGQGQNDLQSQVDGTSNGRYGLSTEDPAAKLAASHEWLRRRKIEHDFHTSPVGSNFDEIIANRTKETASRLEQV